MSSQLLERFFKGIGISTEIGTYRPMFWTVKCYWLARFLVLQTCGANEFYAFWEDSVHGRIAI